MNFLARLFKPKAKPVSNVIMSMILLGNENSFSYSTFITNVKSKFEIKDESGDNTAGVFTIGNDSVSIMHINAPVPDGDIEGTAKYAYNWVSATDDLKDHRSHVIIALMDSDSGPVSRFKLLTNLICCGLTDDAIGVYNGGQSLLTAKKEYLESAALMSDDTLPLNLWIYFGLRSAQSLSNGYTYGLSAFNKTELEIVNSGKSLEDVYSFLYNAAHYSLLTGAEFKSGETLGGSAEQKIQISYSRAAFVEGYSFKFDY